jgi:ubiquinone/menaquinone biosynthesis C-methylase UbiE
MMPGLTAMEPSERRQIQEQYSAMASVYAQFESPRTRSQAQPLLDQLPLEEAGRILDIGTGPGPMIEALRDRAYQGLIVGIDLSRAMLEEAARRTDAHFLMMDATALAFHSGVFDAVLFSHVLFHLPRPELGLIEAMRVLRPAGHVGIASFYDDARTRARASIVIDELLDDWGADQLAAMPRYEKENVTEKDLAEIAEAVRLTPIRYWTQQFRFRVESPSQEVLGKRGLRIGSLTPEEAVQFRREAEAALAELPNEAFEFERTAMYLVARK